MPQFLKLFTRDRSHDGSVSAVTRHELNDYDSISGTGRPHLMYVEELQGAYLFRSGTFTH